MLARTFAAFLLAAALPAVLAAVSAPNARVIQGPLAARGVAIAGAEAKARFIPRDEANDTAIEVAAGQMPPNETTSDAPAPGGGEEDDDNDANAESDDGEDEDFAAEGEYDDYDDKGDVGDDEAAMNADQGDEDDTEMEMPTEDEEKSDSLDGGLAKRGVTRHCANSAEIKRVKPYYSGKCHPEDSKGWRSAHNCKQYESGKSYLCVQNNVATCYTVAEAIKKNLEGGECFK